MTVQCSQSLTNKKSDTEHLDIVISRERDNMFSLTSQSPCTAQQCNFLNVFHCKLQGCR